MMQDTKKMIMKECRALSDEQLKLLLTNVKGKLKDGAKATK